MASALSGGDGRMAGGLVLGPIILDDLPEALTDPLELEAAKKLPQFSPQKVQYLSDVLACVTAKISSEIVPLPKEPATRTEPALFSPESPSGQTAKSLLDFEKKLQRAVLAGEKEQAQELLNGLLAQIYLYSNDNFNIMKARTLELLVILSRTTIEAGADSSEVFSLSENYINQIEQYHDFDRLAVWTSKTVHSFVLQAFDLVRVKYSDVVFKVINYIKKHYGEKLTLDTLAQQAYISKSYLSTVFRKETGFNLPSYITKVRIEKSKQLLSTTNMTLLDIAGLCGFEDQSYFTKTFKKETGVSPKKYRDSASEK